MLSLSVLLSSGYCPPSAALAISRAIRSAVRRRSRSVSIFSPVWAETSLIDGIDRRSGAEIFLAAFSSL